MSDAWREALVAAGWTPDRRVAIDGDLQALRADGYEVWPGVVSFLEEFSGLVVPLADDPYDLCLGAASATAGFFRERAEEYEARLATRLAPVGYRGPMVVLASAKGPFYGGFDDYLGPLGDDAASMIRAIVEHSMEPFQPG